MKEQTPLLHDMLKRWNDRLGHGLSIAPPLLYDLFGRDLEASFEKTFIFDKEQGEQYICLYIAPWVDKDNPFQVLFGYHISIYPDAQDLIIFSLGEETHLLNFLKERVLSEV